MDEIVFFGESTVLAMCFTGDSAENSRLIHYLVKHYELSGMSFERVVALALSVGFEFGNVERVEDA